MAIAGVGPISPAASLGTRPRDSVNGLASKGTDPSWSTHARAKAARLRPCRKDPQRAPVGCYLFSPPTVDNVVANVLIVPR